MLTKKGLQKELLKRKKTVSQDAVFKLDDFLFDKQLAFVNDPSSYKVAHCSRRAGKTTSCAAHLISTAHSEPGVVCLYITLSRNNAKKIIWRDLNKINTAYKLKGVPNISELSLTFPNGSIIYLSGAKDKSEIENFRGLAIKLCYIDEAQSFPDYIRELIDDVLSPALMDYAGTLCIIGTPPPVPVGFFHEIVNNPGTKWSRHHWTFWDNPFIIKKSKITHREMLDRELVRRGVSIDDPSIQREWFGKWVVDVKSLLLEYNKNINDFNELPKNISPKSYNYILGIDLGFNDADALAILAWSEETKVTYLIEELVTREQGLTELVNQINYLSQKYDISKMIIDEGGLGKKLAEEMRRRFQIPVQPADKARKMENIALLNDAMRTGRFKAKSDSKFAQDSFLVEIDRDKSTPTKIVVSSRYHSDIIDAVLYAFKESPAFAYKAPVQGPKPGTADWYAKESEEMFNREVEAIQKQKQDEDYFNNWDENF